MEWYNMPSKIDDLDNNLQEMVQTVHSFQLAAELGKARYELGNVLRFLDEYVDRHFKAEEDYMHRFEYPGADAHLSQHKQFIKEFSEIKTLFQKSGSTNLLTIEVQGRLRQWLNAHVSGEDQALKTFLENAGAEPKKIKTFTEPAD